MNNFQERKSKVKLSRNRLCLCGSGLKYKKCCWLKQFEQPLATQDYHDELRKVFRVCLHPEANDSICGKIIDAHSIQKKRQLESISENGKVFYWAKSLSLFNELKKTGNIHPVLVGINQATIFNGFCSKHDSELFSQIENQDLVLIPKSIFLIGYRGVCRELYTKSMQTKHQDFLVQHATKGQTGLNQLSRQLWNNSIAFSQDLGLKDINDGKNKYDDILLNESFENIEYHYFIINKAPEILSTGASLPIMGFNGETITNYDEMSNDQRLPDITFSILKYSDKGIILFTWMRGDNKSRQLVDSLLNYDIARIPNAIVRYCFTHIENTALKPSWWNNLPTVHANRLIQILNESANPYTDFEYDILKEDNMNYVDWVIEESVKG